MGIFLPLSDAIGEITTLVEEGKVSAFSLFIAKQRTQICFMYADNR
jgi:hypothetical protein